MRELRAQTRTFEAFGIDLFDNYGIWKNYSEKMTVSAWVLKRIGNSCTAI